MCAITIYAAIYHRNIGRNDWRSLWRVRMARELIRQHRATCGECREDGTHTNFNLAPGRPLRREYRGRKPKGVTA